ncbi:hypothetical protein ACGFMK_32215 [Amycolatopsis sp. NPDC049252]|uniref:hypothetical protein n=1 Tax=Amycolatopsis sp. NPDC049252 TaxID=3363933 RepID=UPI003716F54E
MTTTQRTTGAETEHVIPLDTALPEILAGELAKRVYFVAEEILDFRLVRAHGEVVAVAVTTAGPEAPAGLAGKFQFVLHNDVLPQLHQEPRVLWRSPARRPYPPGTFDRLVAAEAACPVGEGQVALGGPVLDLMDDLDGAVRRVVVDEFHGTEFRYPTLIPVGALDRSGYLTSFPQFAMFATRLRADVDTYRGFVEGARNTTDIGGEILGRCDGVDYCLPPTMCYHTFHQYAGRRLPPEVTVVTARGKSFRHEARYHRTLARLWDFTIREIVFFGTRDAVLAAREQFLGRALRLVEALRLSGRCEVAGDPFFCNDDSGVRVSSQRLLELKYELQLDLDDGDSAAVASFNFHERFFGEAFGITLADGSTPFTACVGFGLERLAFAMLCQHGTDIAGWPAGVRAALAGGAHPRRTS